MSTPTAEGVRATTRFTAVPDGRGGTALPQRSGEGPFALRRTRAAAPWARLTLVGAMAAPVGGDRLALDGRVEQGARLTFDSSAATIALPGRTRLPAHYDVRLAVADDACASWLPEPLITAAGCDLHQTTRIELGASARLFYREEQILGRGGEETGRLTNRLVVRRAGSVLLDQQLAYGPGVAGWDSAAVLGGHRAVGQLLVVDPAFAGSPPPPRLLGEASPAGASGAVTPLAGPAVLVTAVAPDGLQLRRLLNSAGNLTSW